jgi:hypothetical protein
MSACPLSNPLMMPSHRAVIARGPGMVTSTVIVSLSPGVTVNSCAAPVAGTARVWPFTSPCTTVPAAGRRPADDGLAWAAECQRDRDRRCHHHRRDRRDDPGARAPSPPDAPHSRAKPSAVKRGGPASAAVSARRERTFRSSIGIAVFPPLSAFRVRQLHGHVGHRLADVPLDRAFGHAEHGRDFGHRQILLVAQHHAGALAGRKAPQRG